MSLFGCGEVTEDEAIAGFNTSKTKDFSKLKESIFFNSKPSEKEILENNFFVNSASGKLSDYPTFYFDLPIELSTEYKKTFGFSILIRELGDSSANIYFWYDDKESQLKKICSYTTTNLFPLNLKDLYFYDESKNHITMLYYKEVERESEKIGINFKPPMRIVANRVYIFKTIIDLNSNTIEHNPYVYITKYKGDTIETVYVE